MNGLSANKKLSKFQLYKLIQLRGYLKFLSILNAISLVRPIASSMISFVNSSKAELKNKFSKSKENAESLVVDATLNSLTKIVEKRLSSVAGSAITLASNEIKYIIKVINSLKSRFY